MRADSDESDYETILNDVARLHLGVDLCLSSRGGGRWREWEEAVLEALAEQPTLADSCVQYATAVVQGQWEEFEEKAFANPVSIIYLIDYLKSGVVKAPNPSFEKRIHKTFLFNQPTLAYFYAKYVLGNPWENGEKIILDSVTHYSAIWLQERKISKTAPAEYALDLKNGSWQELERLIDRGECVAWVAVDYAERVRKKPLDLWERRMLQFPLPRDDASDSPRLDAVAHYLKQFPQRRDSLLEIIIDDTCDLPLAMKILPVLGFKGRCREFENKLLSLPISKQGMTAIVRYAYRFFRGGWSDAEDYFFTHANSNNFLSAVIFYAEEMRKGRWARIERRLIKSPKHVLRYANRVVKGKLSGSLHAMMIMRSFTKDKYARRYAKKYGK
jgi:hypothetical protein